MKIFRHVPLIEQSIMQKVFRQYPKENAIIELNNLLASSPIQSIKLHDISVVEEKYEIDFRKSFRLNLEEFYAVTLNYFLQDNFLSNDEFADLENLKSILSLSDRSISKIHNMVGEIVYKRAFEEVVADGRISEKEKAFLERLEQDLKLSKELSNKISEEIRSRRLQEYLSQAMEDARLSPEEEKEFKAIAKSLNVEIKMSSAGRKQYERLKLYWTLENNDLPEHEPDINLQKGEKCYFFEENVDWFELRTNWSSASHSRYSENSKLVKEFYLSLDNVAGISPGYLTLIDKGALYLTNKRIIFAGHKKNVNIKLDKILNIKPYTNGVEISKESGRNPFLQMKKNADVFSIVTSRVITE